MEVGPVEEGPVEEEPVEERRVGEEPVEEEAVEVEPVADPYRIWQCAHALQQCMKVTPMASDSQARHCGPHVPAGAQNRKGRGASRSPSMS